MGGEVVLLASDIGSRHNVLSEVPTERQSRLPERKSGCCREGELMQTAQVPKRADTLCFWVCILILLSNLAHVDGQLFVQLSGVLILLLSQEAAFLSWQHVLLPKSKGCHTPCYWGAQAQVQRPLPMLICKRDRD